MVNIERFKYHYFVCLFMEDHFLEWYANQRVFEKRVNQGFREVAFGDGNWIEGEKVPAVFVFYHPDGRVGTYGHLKFQDERTHETYHGKPSEIDFANLGEFERYCDEKGIRITRGRENLEDVFERVRIIKQTPRD